MNMQPIKIVYIIDSMNSVSGTEKQLIQMMSHLNKHLFKPILICLRKPSAVFDYNESDFEYIELNVPKLLSMNGIIQFNKLVKFLRKEKIDIVQTFFFDSCLFGVLAARVAGVKKIISSRRDMGFWYKTKLLLIMRIINSLTHRILVNSNSIKENVMQKEKVNPDKIDVICNGIDFEPFQKKYDSSFSRNQLKIPDDHKVVGIVANLNRRVKRVDVFLKAAAEILKKDNKVSFVIVGDGYLREELEMFAKNLNIFDYVHFLGQREDILSIIKAWDIGTITSDSEGLSNSLIEYMLSGLSVVSTDSGGNKEIINDGYNGFLVPIGDSQLICQKCLYLLENNDKRSEMGKRAKLTIINNYIWSTKIKEIECYYNVLYNS